MSIRPRFSLIVGFDARGIKRGKSIDLEESIPAYLSDPDDFPISVEEANQKYLYEILYNPKNTSEYHNKNIVGFILEKGEYDSNFIRALAAIYPEKYGGTNYWVIPHRKSKDIDSLVYGYSQEDIDCNRYVAPVFMWFPVLSRLHWKKALFYLSQAGWHVTEKDLHYILVLDWS